MGRHTSNFLSYKLNTAGLRLQQSGNGAENCRLASTISTNQTRKLAALQGQGQILEDGTARVAGVQVRNLKNGLGAHC